MRSLDRVTITIAGVRRTYPGRLLAAAPTSHGRLCVTLSDGPSRRWVHVHTLVAEEFIGVRPPGMDVLHDSGDPTDNRAVNLKYGTASDNQRDAVRHGTHSKTRRTYCPREHPLIVPNLRPTQLEKYRRRTCLACYRAIAYCDRHPCADLRAVSDRYYEAIMEAA